MPALDRLTVRCLEAADHLRLRGTGRALLLLLCAQADRSGACWPTMSTLAQQAGTQRRYTLELLTQLEGHGLVQVTRRPGRGSVYRLTPPDVLRRMEPLPEIPGPPPADPWPG